MLRRQAAGVTFVLLDSKHPPSRLQTLTAQARVLLVLTDPSTELQKVVPNISVIHTITLVSPAVLHTPSYSPDIPSSYLPLLAPHS